MSTYLKMEVLTLLNPWWKSGKISLELAPPFRRSAFSRLVELSRTKQMTLLTGLRRVGKSTLFYQLIEDLLKAPTNPRQVLYFSFDEKTVNILDVFQQYAELTGVDWKKEKIHIFFDEIQKLEDWSNKLKLIYDQCKNLKIFISGSSSFELEKAAKVNLAGRYFILSLPPLSFREYLQLKKSPIDPQKPQLWKEEIKKEFEHYLRKPFPEIVGSEEVSLIKAYIKDNVIEKILRVDLAKKFNRVNEGVLTALINIVYGKPGIYLNYDDLAKDLKISKKTLLQHFYYLEFAYLIRKVKNFRPGTRIVSRKLQRAYPYHWSLGFGWTGDFDFETIVASLLDAHYYWRELQKEVDFLLLEEKIIPIEVKKSVKVEKSDLRPLLFFMDKFLLSTGLVIYSGEKEISQVGKMTITKRPLWDLALSQK